MTRAGRESVVIVALDEYESLRETAYLLGNPANAARLFRSIEELEGGGGSTRELIGADRSDDSESRDSDS